MPRRYINALLLFLGLGPAPAVARDLQVDVEVLHVGGMLAPSEMEALLADERLSVEALYHPTRLVDGVTARRERTMPFGSRLFAINQYLNLKGAQIERRGRRVRFRVPDIPPGHAHYRLRQLSIRAPVAPGLGRPQPDLRIDLLQEPPEAGARETLLLVRNGAFDLGLRLNYRWSDAHGPATAQAPTCSADVHSLGNGQYRFRPRHRLAGLFEFLAPVVQSDPPTRPPAGQRSVRLRAPFPEPVTGWNVSRNHLVQIEIDGQPVERLSLYAQQAGAGNCRRTRAYDALFAGGKPVAVQRSVHEAECDGEGIVRSESVEASWLDDDSLARYLTNTPQGSQTWDGFSALASGCGAGVAPPQSEVQQLVAEVARIRNAFLQP